MQKTICVFSSSSDAVAPMYFEAAANLGKLIAQNDYKLVYGGTTVGLMGAVSRAVHDHGGKVIGVIPEAIHNKGIAYEEADELIVTDDLSKRKMEMEEKADVFVALPGGFGTLEEIMEVLTLKQLRFHSKPVIFLNTNGFYNHLKNHFELLFNKQFSKEIYRKLYYFSPDVASIFSYIQAYKPALFQEKWF